MTEFGEEFEDDNKFEQWLDGQNACQKGRHEFEVVNVVYDEEKGYEEPILKCQRCGLCK